MVIENHYIVHTWFERDRANIWVEDENGNNVAEWWDEDLMQMVEDGFFDMRGKNRIGKSVLQYLAKVGAISKNYTFEVD